MHNFEFLDETVKNRLFYKHPENFTKDSSAELIALALGATIYTPGNRPTLAKDILKMRKNGSTSVIICLEDSIPDDEVENATFNVLEALEILGDYDEEELPLIFIRPHDTTNLKNLNFIIRDQLNLLTGFSLPKFSASNAYSYMELIKESSKISRKHIYAMPILESPEIVFYESRLKAFDGIAKIVTDPRYRNHILNLRIGATDMSSPFGLRRSRDLNIYNVRVIADAIGGIVNKFGRAEDNFVISGPVWEHFTDRERLFKPKLRQSLFPDNEALAFRKKLIMDDLDGLIREVELDRANGLWGKTVIHPTHVNVVNSMLVVSHEEYSDALAILNSDNGGAIASNYRNKMNETKPHNNWATKTILRAKAFGVANEGLSFADFMEASIK